MLVCIEEFEDWRECLLHLKMTESGKGCPCYQRDKILIQISIDTNIISYKLRKNTGCFSPAKFKDHEVDVRKTNCLVNHMCVHTISVYVLGILGGCFLVREFLFVC